MTSIVSTVKGLAIIRGIRPAWMVKKSMLFFSTLSCKCACHLIAFSKDFMDGDHMMNIQNLFNVKEDLTKITHQALNVTRQVVVNLRAWRCSTPWSRVTCFRRQIAHDPYGAQSPSIYVQQLKITIAYGPISAQHFITIV